MDAQHEAARGVPEDASARATSNESQALQKSLVLAEPSVCCRSSAVHADAKPSTHSGCSTRILMREFHVGSVLLNHAGLRELLDKSKDNFYIIARSNEQIGGLLDHAGL